jgi:hypothetical protein
MRRVLILAVAITLVGCGRRESRQSAPLRFEEPPDTARLSRGKPLLGRIEPRRENGGPLRIAGRMDLPDGTRVQLSIYRKGTNRMITRMQVVIQDHRFETPPVRGSVPHGAYRLEYLALFNPVWQPASVLDATDQGRSLRGPGITRDSQGGATFFLVEERNL